MLDLSSLKNIAKTAIDNKDSIASGAKSVASFLHINKKKSGNQEDQTPAAAVYSPGLERMITMAVEDGELSEEEIALLAKRAEKEGVDPDEFIFELKMRIKKRNKEHEYIQNLNPVEALSNAFKTIEQDVTGGKKVIDGGALTAAIGLIPGVGQVAAIGGLVASFIESPSNRNELKAEIIRLFVLPDEPEYLQQFISYAASQLTEEYKKNQKSSLKSVISKITVGEGLDIIPIWENKLEEACTKAEISFPENALLMNTVRKYRPTLINKLRNGLIDFMDLYDYKGPLPSEAEELLKITEMIYARKQAGDDWSELRPLHAKFYSMAENLISKGHPLYERLVRCKIRKFGIF